MSHFSAKKAAFHSPGPARDLPWAISLGALWIQRDRFGFLCFLCQLRGEHA
jgi:hypothetical protein